MSPGNRFIDLIMEEYKIKHTPLFGEEPCWICNDLTESRLLSKTFSLSNPQIVCDSCIKKLPRECDEPFYIRLAKWIVNK